MAIHQGLSKEKFIYSSFELRCAGVCWGKTFSFLTQIRPPGLYDYEAGGFRWWGPHLGDIAWWSCVVGIHTLWEKVLMRDCLQFDSSQKVFETFVGFPGNEPWIVGWWRKSAEYQGWAQNSHRQVRVRLWPLNGLLAGKGLSVQLWVLKKHLQIW